MAGRFISSTANRANSEQMDYETDFDDGYAGTSVGKIYYRHHKGEGEKLILLHGLGANARSWKNLMFFMPDTLDIYLIDLLGHGNSDKPKIDYTISMQVQMLREFIALNNNGDSYLMGHSYGAWICAYYASQPYSAKGLILEDAAGLKLFFDDLQISGTLQQEKEEVLKQTLQMNGNEKYVIQSALDNRNEFLDETNLSKITQKTLVLWGSDDSTLNVKYAEEFKKQIPNSDLQYIEGGGHTPHFTRPKQVSEKIINFIG